MSYSVYNRGMHALFSIPNMLSASRLLAAPLLAVVFYLPRWTEVSQSLADVMTMAVFAVAAITDFMDGYLARKNKIKSRFGAILDPTADKILVITALLILLEAGRAPLFACWLIIAREVLMSAVREWAAEKFAQETQVSVLGKYKTGVQLTAILCLFADNSVLDIPAHHAGVLFLWLSAVLGIISMIGYCIAIWRAQNQIQNQNENDAVTPSSHSTQQGTE